MSAIPLLLPPRGNVQNADPTSGRVTIPITLDFTTSFADSFVADFGQLTAGGVFDYPRTVWVDNSRNPNQLLVTVSQVGQNFPIPPYSVAQVPLYAQPGSTVTFSSLGIATGLVYAVFYNTRELAFSYSGFAPIIPGFQVESLYPSLTNLTIRSAALVGGVAQDIFPAVAATRMVFFQNIGGDEAFFRIGATAVGTFPQDIPIQPQGEVLPIALPFRTNQRISFFCPVACNILAFEGT